MRTPARRDRPRSGLARVAPLLVTVALVAVLVWLWDWLVQSGRVHRIVLPEPSQVASSLPDLVTSETFRTDLRTTVLEIAIGYAAGAVAGLVLALASVAWPSVRRLLAPYIVVFQAIPKVVFIPLLAVWFGIGFGSATVVVALVTFFPVYVNGVLGLTAVDRDGLVLLRSLRASKVQTFVMYRLPSALPLLFTGGKMAVNYAILAAITAEFLGAREGLGYRIVALASRLQLDALYATVLIVSLLSGLVYLLLEWLDRRLVFWRERPVR
ncbi:ABC transporter permease [Geodermatophilus sp. SYSU D00697]